MECFEEIFDYYSIEMMGKEVAPVAEIKKVFDNSMPYIDSTIRDKLYMIFDYSNKGIVNK